MDNAYFITFEACKRLEKKRPFNGQWKKTIGLGFGDSVNKIIQFGYSYELFPSKKNISRKPYCACYHSILLATTVCDLKVTFTSLTMS